MVDAGARRRRVPAARSPTPTTHNADAETIARLQHENQTRLEATIGHGASPTASGSAHALVPGRARHAGVALAFAVAVPLIERRAHDRRRRSTDAAAHAGWIETWMLLLGRLGRAAGGDRPGGRPDRDRPRAVGDPGPGRRVLLRAGRAGRRHRRAGRRGGPPAQRRAGAAPTGCASPCCSAVFGALTWAARLLADLVVPDTRRSS